MDNGYEEVLERLKEERIRLGWSQTQISEMLEIEQSHYSKVERGVARLTYYEVQRLYEIDVDADYVFMGIRQNQKFADALKEKDDLQLSILLEILYTWVEYRKINPNLNAHNMRLIRLTCSENKTLLFSLRRGLDKNQLEMADLLGVDVKKLRALENGGTLPDSEIIWKLYKDFGILPAIVVNSREGIISEISSLIGMLKAGETERISYTLRDIDGLFQLFLETDNGKGAMQTPQIQ